MSIKDQLYAGFGKADITPGWPVATLWSLGEKKLCSTVKSRLYSRVTVLKDHKKTIALISLDLLGVNLQFSEKLKNKLKRFNIKKNHIAVCCTHSHTVPITLSYNFQNPLRQPDKRYLNFLEKQIITSVSKAVKDLQPASLEAYKTNAYLNVNRREMGRIAQYNSLEGNAGHVDTELGIISIMQASSSPALLLSYSAHPLSIFNKKSPNVISADFCGELIAKLEKKYKFAQFFQGCSGDCNVRINGGIQASKKAGRILSKAVNDRLKNARHNNDKTCKILMKTKKLKVPAENLKKLLKINKAIIEKENIKDPDHPALCWYKTMNKVKKPASTIPSIIQTLKVGDMDMVFLPGEQFTKTGQEIKKKTKNPLCFVIACANSADVGYVPVPSAFKKGGYEVDEAYKFRSYRVARNAAGFFVKEVIAMILINKKIRKTGFLIGKNY